MLAKNLSFIQHIVLSLIIRIILIVYGNIQDETSEVPYTDIDYKVVTDGARYILQGETPFLRHTYRYSPLLSFILIPNVTLHKSFGKFVFSIFDILVGILIERIVYNELKATFFETAEAIFARHGKEPNEKLKKLYLPEKYKNWAKWAAYFWLYNPLTMVVATRGNGDSFSSFFVLATIYFLQKYQSTNNSYFLAGICHGIAIHLRIYPIIFSLAFFLNLSDTNIKNILFIIPNKKQIFLILGTILSLFTLTGIFYHLYGWQYIYEAYLYHIIRKDIRHNFSLYFLMQYLNTNIDLNYIEKLFTLLPQIIILVYFSIVFGSSKKTLSFCIFAQTFIMVSYNTVVTSQYFIWYLALLPLCIKNLRNISKRLAIVYFCLWMLAQGLWLLPAYLLEFKTLNTFNFVGIQSICFFFINIFILQRLIYNFDVFIRVK